MRIHALFQYVIAIFYSVALSTTSTAAEQPASADASKSPHIAIILPLQSKALGEPSEAIKAGIAAAASKPSVGDLPYMVYPIADETTDLQQTYQEAIDAGATVVVGPLTLAGVKSMAAKAPLPVPTLALNTLPEGPAVQGLYSLNLSAAAEGKLVADKAVQAGYQQAATITIESPLAQRIQQAFASEWQARGGTLSMLVNVPAAKPDYTVLRTQMAQCNCDVIFIAADANRTKLIKPFLPAGIPVYSTSQGFSGKVKSASNLELEGMRLFDMPWLLQPDHPAVMVYPRSAKPLVVEDERLYALGIDALRIAELLAKTTSGPIELDGVTGHLTLGKDGNFIRELQAADVRGGEVIRVLP
ncbi:penicillin-binding protein activator [Leeia oryzae]|uniref:penicillin-binding protein activator n=1 Tax=Leeia oryzae TaxID=356662 RepID=UPI000365BFE8|nr:penicillin-binding protein activator [Leeia oryzae]